MNNLFIMRNKKGEQKMTRKSEYKARKGFYDLSKKPKTLTKKEHNQKIIFTHYDV